MTKTIFHVFPFLTNKTVFTNFKKRTQFLNLLINKQKLLSLNIYFLILLINNNIN